MLATGKSFELIGMAAFNMFLAAILSVTFLGKSESTGLNRLTDESISQFIHEAADITSGDREGVDPMGITEYLMQHIDDEGVFKSTIQIDMPQVRQKEQKLELNKKDYIGHVIEGLKSMKDHEETTRIESIEIANGATKARVVTSSAERGAVPVDGEDGPATMQVRGITYCEQELVLKEKIIKMAGAVCSTNIQQDSSAP